MHAQSTCCLPCADNSLALRRSAVQTGRGRMDKGQADGEVDVRRQLSLVTVLPCLHTIQCLRHITIL